MKHDLRMISELRVGTTFWMSENDQTYRLLAKIQKGEDSLIEGYLAKNTSAQNSMQRPFLIEGDRPVMVDKSE